MECEAVLFEQKVERYAKIVDDQPRRIWGFLVKRESTLVVCELLGVLPTEEWQQAAAVALQKRYGFAPPMELKRKVGNNRRIGIGA